MTFKIKETHQSIKNSALVHNDQPYGVVAALKIIVKSVLYNCGYALYGMLGAVWSAKCVSTEKSNSPVCPLCTTDF